MTSDHNSTHNSDLRDKFIVAISTIAIINIFALIYTLLKTTLQVGNFIKISPAMSLLVAFISLIPSTAAAPPGADEMAANSSRVIYSGWNRDFEIDQVKNNLKEYGSARGTFDMIPFFAIGYFAFTLFISKLLF